MNRLFILALMCGASAVSQAEEFRDSVTVYFPVASHKLDMGIPANEWALNAIVDRLHDRSLDSLVSLKKVLVEGASSPEGDIEYNYNLSRERANTLFNFIKDHQEIPDSLMMFRFMGRDWPGLVTLVEKDPKVPYHDESLDLVRKLAREAELGMQTNGDQITQMKSFRRGVPYRYMYNNLFPELRKSIIYLYYDRRPQAVVKQVEVDSLPAAMSGDYDTAEVIETTDEPVADTGGKFYMDLSTNMLYDLAAVPNIGIEFYLGKNISIDANWMYAWWSKNRRHRYWRIYGGDLELRWWFGSKAHEKPLTGHHIGAYFQAFTYDFEFGNKGYMGGKPGRPLWDRATIGGGVSYGYSHPIARRLNIDFELGIGYLSGKCLEYKVMDDHYVWTSTKMRHWFGPTKLEISLVWLIGNGNFNSKKEKGGKNE